MEFTVDRPDRFPPGTVVGLYGAEQAQLGRAPVGSELDSVEADAEGVTFTGLEERGRYVAFATVDGFPRYVQFMAPARSDRAPADFDVPDWDEVSGQLAWATPPGGVGPSWWIFGVVTGPVSAEEAERNVERVQAWLDACEPFGWAHAPALDSYVQLYGTVRQPTDLKFLGAGEQLTRFFSHPDYAQNGPILANKVDALGDVIPVGNGMLAFMTWDGDFLNNSQFNVRCELVDPVTPSDTTYHVTSTADFPAAGRFATTETSDHVNRATYTSKDDTHFYGVVQDTSTDHTTWSADADTELRLFSESAVGLVRFYAYDNLILYQFTARNSWSYNTAGEGRPYDTDESHRGPKNRLLLVQVTFEDSWASDSLDIKSSSQTIGIAVKCRNGGDKGLNVRGEFQSWYGCVTEDCRTGYGLTSSPQVDSTQRFNKAITAGVTETDTTITVSSTVGPPASGMGWFGATERCAYTVASPTTYTLTRAQEGTRAAAHASGTTFNPDYDVDDVEAFRGTIDLFGCSSLNDITGMNLNAGGSYTRATVHGGTIKGATLGLQAIAVLGPMEIDVYGLSVYDCQTGAKMTRCVYVNLDMKIRGSTGNLPADVGTDSPGDGLILEDCSNYNVIKADISGNAGFGFRATGTTNHVHTIGRAPWANTLGAWNLGAKCTDTTGDWFGDPSPGFVPRYVHETVPIEYAKDTYSLVSGTVVVSPFVAKATQKVTVLTTQVRAAAATVTHAILGLVELSGTNYADFTKLVATDDHPGGVFTATGFKNNLTLVGSATYWLEKGKTYGVAVLWVGTGSPTISALTPAAVDDLTSYRPIMAGTIAAAGNDIPASGTLTPITTTKVYAGAQNGG